MRKISCFYSKARNGFDCIVFWLLNSIWIFCFVSLNILMALSHRFVVLLFLNFEEFIEFLRFFLNFSNWVTVEPHFESCHRNGCISTFIGFDCSLDFFGVNFQNYCLIFLSPKTLNVFFPLNGVSINDRNILNPNKRLFLCKANRLGKVFLKNFVKNCFIKCLLGVDICLTHIWYLCGLIASICCALSAGWMRISDIKAKIEIFRYK